MGGEAEESGVSNLKSLTPRDLPSRVIKRPIYAKSVLVRAMQYKSCGFYKQALVHVASL